MYESFDELFQAAKDAEAQVCVLCGVQYNVRGKLSDFNAKVIVLTLEDTTNIMLDRTKMIGAFIAPIAPASENTEEVSDES